MIKLNNKIKAKLNYLDVDGKDIELDLSFSDLGFNSLII
jgi:hypothetical protein